MAQAAAGHADPRRVGFPEQFITRNVHAAAVLPTFVYMDAVHAPPDMAKPFPRFYGKLAPGS